MLGPMMVDLDGHQLSAEEFELLQHPMIGGVILFQRNYQDKQQLRELVRAIRAIRPELLIAADQEGGRVQRFVHEFTSLPALAELGEMYERDSDLALQQTAHYAKVMATELLSVGIDFCFAPVLDLNQSQSEVIGCRSFHQQAAVVSELATHYVQAMHRHGMAAVGKHFPGHGSVAPDTHLTTVVDEREYAQIESQDLQPFLALIQQGIDAIMPALITFPSVDSLPAAFSPVWLKTLLRERYGFTGTIISDDLSMQGASVIGDEVARVRQALTAGCDIILLCNDRGAVLNVIDKLQIQQVPTSQQRLMNMKAKGEQYELH